MNPKGFVFLLFLQVSLGVDVIEYFVAPGGVQNIESPGYPSYGNNQNHQWNIVTYKGDYIRLQFNDFSLQDYCCDFVTVYSGGMTIARYNSGTIPKDIMSLDNTMIIIFDSDRSITSTGFRASLSVAANGDDSISTDFTTGFGGWVQETWMDSIDWSRTSGTTTNNNTGPANGHSASPADDSYIYIDTSSTSDGDNARLKSPALPAWDDICVQFYYNMHGKDVDTLRVWYHTTPTNSVTKWFLEGDQGPEWHYGFIDYQNYYYYFDDPDNYVMFEAVAGDGPQGIIAVDDILISEGPCPQLPVTTAGPTTDGHDFTTIHNRHTTDGQDPTTMFNRQTTDGHDFTTFADRRTTDGHDFTTFAGRQTTDGPDFTTFANRRTTDEHDFTTFADRHTTVGHESTAFADKRTTDAGSTNPTPMVQTDVDCSDSSMTVYIGQSSLIDTTYFPPHLMDPSCTDYQVVIKDGVSWIVFVTRYDACGTQVNFEGDFVEYSNAVYYKNVGSSTVVSRELQHIVPVKCSLNNSGKSSINFNPQEVQVIAEPIEEIGNFSFSLDMFTSSNFKTAYEDDAYPVVVDIGEMIYIGAHVKSFTPDIKLYIDECVATPSSDQYASPSYDIIKKSCPSDSTTTFSNSNNTDVHFSVEAFRFIEVEGPVYVHCEMSLCNATDPSCNRPCSQRNRRAVVLKSYMKKSLTRSFNIRRDVPQEQALSVKESKNVWNQSKPVVGVFLAMNSLFLVGVAVYVKRRRSMKPQDYHQLLE